jgi:hypothetical protein
MTITKTIPAPDMTVTLDAARRDTKVSLNAVQIGIIEAFDPARQVATVRIALRQVREIKPDGTRVLQEYPLIKECPVVTMFGGDSFINLPIQPGDNCLVFFNDREIDQWLYNGGVQTPVTPRVHDISDAIALVGIRHYQNSIAQFLANGIRISFASNSRIDLQEEAINSVADLFTHVGDFRVQGNFYVTGDMYGENGGALSVKTDIVQEAGFELHAGNGASGTFDTVVVVDGIVVSGS